MSFYPRRAQGGDPKGEVRDFIVTNSQTIALGDMVVLTSGFALRASAGGRIVGCAVGFVRDLGNNQRVPLDQSASGTITGTRTGNAGVIGSDTYAAASSNQTVDKVMVRVLVDPQMEYLNTASSTLTTAMVGQYFDLVSGATQVDVATNTNTYSAQVLLTRLDPDNDASVTKGLFRIIEHAWT